MARRARAPDSFPAGRSTDSSSPKPGGSARPERGPVGASARQETGQAAHGEEQGLKMNPQDRIGYAWAVVDANNGEENSITAYDIQPTRKEAIRLRNIRRKVSYPLVANAKWIVIRVLIQRCH